MGWSVHLNNDLQANNDSSKLFLEGYTFLYIHTYMNCVNMQLQYTVTFYIIEVPTHHPTIQRMFCFDKTIVFWDINNSFGLWFYEQMALELTELTCHSRYMM